MRARVFWMAAGGVWLAAQLVPVDRRVPPPGGELVAPPAVEAALRSACYDCHSSHTDWPWYSHVAPVSWLVAHDVAAARARLNFSEWDAYASDPETAAHKLDEIRAALATGDMAPWYYRLLHPAARLTDAQRAALAAWLASSGPLPPA